MYADGDLDRKNIAVVSAGRGAEHAYMGCLNFSFYDWRRQAVRLKQAGRGGLGTVFRHKNIKAMVIKNRGVTPAWRVEENKVAHLITPQRVTERCRPRTSPEDRRASPTAGTAIPTTSSR
jgi:aldehyde:ferredoxin oxidoreductase